MTKPLMSLPPAPSCCATYAGGLIAVVAPDPTVLRQQPDARPRCETDLGGTRDSLADTGVNGSFGPVARALPAFGVFTGVNVSSVLLGLGADGTVVLEILVSVP